jgi:hypothetical protein
MWAYMVVVVLFRCPHGCRLFMSLYTWLSSSYFDAHMVVVLLCRCTHGCRRLIQRHKKTTTMCTAK